MFRHSLRPYTWLGGLTALFLAITAAAGLFVKDIYRPFISAGLLPGLYAQDAISLLAAPALVAAMVFTHRCSARAAVVWIGLLVYTAYYYAFYAFDHFVTAVYPLYIALIGLAVYGLIGLLTSIDLAAFAKRVRRRMPVRFIAAVLGVTLLFVPLWLLMMAQDIAAGQARETATVFVLDLAFLIPACTLAAVLIWQRRPLGYLLGGALLFKATLSGLLLTAGTVLTLAAGVPIGPDFGMYVFLLIMGGAAVVSYMRNLGEPA